MAVQICVAMPGYLIARRGGSSACQADTRPGLKALEQKRKRSVVGGVQVRGQDMEPQEADQLSRLPRAARGHSGKGDTALMGRVLGADPQGLLRSHLLSLPALPSGN